MDEIHPKLITKLVDKGSTKQDITDDISGIRSDNGFCEWVEKQIKDACGQLDPDTRKRLDQSIKSKIQKLHSSRYRKYKIMVVAAVIVAAFLGGAAVWMTTMNDRAEPLTLTIATGTSEKAKVTLPDGTKVNINDNTTIRYIRSGKDDTRLVECNGEALFDVAHDPEHPFIVKNGELNVRCLGTVFNVKAYEDDPTVTVTLVEGSICASSRESSITISPNTMVTYSKKSGKMDSQKINAADYTEWTDGYLRFNDESLASVARTLQRRYNVKIKMSGNIAAEHITGSIGNGDIKDVLRMICLTSDHKFIQEGDSLYIIY